MNWNSGQRLVSRRNGILIIVYEYAFVLIRNGWIRIVSGPVAFRIRFAQRNDGESGLKSNETAQINCFQARYILRTWTF